jgi:hypothetical protein
MPRPVLAPDTYADLPFPTAGVDLSAGYGAQRPGSARLGTNVRAFEPGSQRMRGGARPGLSKYLGQLPNGAQKVQHLTAVVDPSGTALLCNFDFPPPFIADPSSPGLSSDWPPGQSSRIPSGQEIPQGGSLVQPNKQVPMGPASVRVKGIKFVQAASAGTFVFGSGGTATASYDANVAANDLVVAFAATPFFSLSNSMALAVSDSLGLSWTAAGSTGYGDRVLYAWYALTGSGGACTVTVTATGSAGSFPLTVSVGLLEYSGEDLLTPFDAAATNDGAGASVTSLTTGAVGIDGSGRLLLGLFHTEGAATLSADTGTARINDGFLLAAEILPASRPSQASTVTASAGVTYDAVGASFKPA